MGLCLFQGKVYEFDLTLTEASIDIIKEHDDFCPELIKMKEASVKTNTKLQTFKNIKSYHDEIFR